MKVAGFQINSFIESPGNHRSFFIDLTTRSMLGQYMNKIVKPVSRQLVMCVELAWRRYNKIVEQHFVIHRIVQKMDAIDNLTKMCGFPSPSWLAKMIKKLHKQMDEIRVHAEKKCRKLLMPAAEFSPPIQYWYDKIHAYEALIRRKEGKPVKNTTTPQFAKQKEIKMKPT